MKSMRPTFLHKIFLGFATILSLLAQGFVFAPLKFTFILHHLPAWGNLTFGALLFVASLILFVFIIRLLKSVSITNWTLLAIQALTIIGIHFLLNSSASHAREAGFLFTGAITTLTAFGIFVNII